jgi:hypothetical protein
MAKGFTIYTIETADGTDYAATLREARVMARNTLKEVDWLDEVAIDRCVTVDMTRENLIDILRTCGGSWCASSETIETVRR